MTRFLEQRLVDLGGKRLTVMTKPGANLDELAKASQGALEDARRRLARTLEVIQGELTAFQKQFAITYFRTGPEGFTKGDLMWVKVVLRSTLTGLAGDVTIKTGSNVGRPTTEEPAGKNVFGSVGSDPLHEKAPDKPYHSVTPKLSQDSSHYTYGAMKLDGARLSDKKMLGSQTLIHEATHKYAGTADHYYFGAQTGAKDRLYDTALPTKEKALENADSFAWFAWYVGKPKA